MAKSISKKKSKPEKLQQQTLGIDEGLSGRVSGFFYRLRKLEDLISIAPFWKSPLIWFVLSFDIFAYVVMYFLLDERLNSIPQQIPFFYYYPEGPMQLINSNELWYFLIGFGVFSAVNLIAVGVLFQKNRQEAKFLLIAEFLKTLFFVILIYKTFINWLA